MQNKSLFLGISLSVVLLSLSSCGDVMGDLATSYQNDLRSPTIGVLKTVPSGRFQRDADPSHITIITRKYWMSRYEITRSQFQSVMGVDPGINQYSTSGKDPVHNINFYHALAFCNKLSLKEGLIPVYSVVGVDFNTLSYGSIPTLVIDAAWDMATADWTANGYRLPTEMEWMWAAMGATGSWDKPFPGSTGSNSIDDYVWYTGTCGNGNASHPDYRIHPVGSKKANELGLFDMGGNVAEWCWDWYAPDPTIILTDYPGPSGVYTDRVMRGGWWYSESIATSASYRLAATPGFGALSSIGFRVVRN